MDNDRTGTRRRTRQASLVVTTFLTVALTASACGGSSSNNNRRSTSGKAGGTLYLLGQSDYEHLDPQRAYVSNSLNFVQLFERQLTMYTASGTKIVPDLATDMGTPSDGAKTWKFTLKPGIKFEDGTPIRSTDIKYGVERTFAQDTISDGPQYAVQYLVNNDNYQGPYVGNNNNGHGLTSIETPDDRTIIFHLKQPVSDFSSTVAFPAFGPVEASKDAKDGYDNHPVASGPYKIQSYDRGTQITLVRNPYWSRKTDLNRPALPDRIVDYLNLDLTTLTQRLIADQGQDQSATTIDSNVAPDQMPRTRTPSVKSRTITGLDIFTWYLGLNTRKITNLAVRKALEYAADRQGYTAAYGGVPSAGRYAYTVINPTNPAYKKFNLYPAPPSGDPAKAKQVLQQAGVQTPVPLTFAYSNTPLVANAFAALQRGFERDNLFKITPQPIARKVYYTTVGQPAQEPDIVLVGWGQDWPAGSTVIPPLFQGSQILQQGNQNYSQLDDPGVNRQVTAAYAQPDFKKAQAMWGDIDEAQMRLAATIPLRYEGDVVVRGSKVTGATFNAQFAGPSTITLGVQR
ncbi:MAG: ABC transporter substrate-binding protein [Mycobacteriales bacterium]